jgi:hypothetical protein
MTGRNERTTRAAIAAALAQGCVLCGERAAAVGAFLPDHPQEWGAPPGMSRQVLYGLCGGCADPPANVDAIEARLALGRRAA